MKNIILRSYKMANDCGFAPNPDGAYLTLATCKPGIRRCHREEQWLAGFTSCKLNGDKMGYERLVYLANISKIVSMREYGDSYSEYPERIDNIYKWNDGEYMQLANPYHSEENKIRDIKGCNVLIADEFYYFGRNAVGIPEEFRGIYPKSQTPSGKRTEGDKASEFILWIKNYVVKHYEGKNGKLGEPHEYKRRTNVAPDVVIDNCCSRITCYKGCK